MPENQILYPLTTRRFFGSLGTQGVATPKNKNHQTNPALLQTKTLAKSNPGTQAPLAKQKSPNEPKDAANKQLTWPSQETGLN
jgi:hypothetical protein